MRGRLRAAETLLPDGPKVSSRQVGGQSLAAWRQGMINMVKVPAVLVRKQCGGYG